MALDEATLRYLANRQRVMYPADPPGYVRPRHTEGLAPTRAIMPSPSRPPGLGETTLADEIPLDLGNFRPESTMRPPEMAVQGPPSGRVQGPPPGTPMRQEAVGAPPGGPAPVGGNDGGGWFPSSQAGWASANSAIAPLLGDWRTTPAQVIAAALGGYGQGKYAADQDQAQQQRRDELLDLQKAQLLFEAQQQQGKAAQQQMLMDEIATIKDPNERKIAMLDPEGYAKAKADQMFAPPADPVRLGAGETLFDPATGQQIAQGPAKPLQVGNDLLVPGPDGSYSLAYRAPFSPQQGREAPETWRTLSPEEAKAAGYPGGAVVQMSSRGQLNTEFKPASADGSEPLMAINTPEGPRYVPRTQAIGQPPADTRELAGSEGEREDKRITGIVDRVAANGGWGNIPQEDRSWYELKYREKAAPKVGLDPNTGLIVSTTPDVSYLPMPASMQPAAPASAPPAPSPMAMPLPAAPSQAQAYGPGGYLDPIAPGLPQTRANPAALSKFGFAP